MDCSEFFGLDPGEPFYLRPEEICLIRYQELELWEVEGGGVGIDRELQPSLDLWVLVRVP